MRALVFALLLALATAVPAFAGGGSDNFRPLDITVMDVGGSESWPTP
jgi:hypothetical protein